MTLRRKISLAFAALILLALGWHFWPNGEPKYNGKSVSDWYKIYCRYVQRGLDLDRANEALDALRHIGTNALPYLLDQAYSTNKDSASRSNFIVFVNSLPGWLNAPVMATADEMRMNATSAIYQLKPPAGPLMDLLAEHAHSTNFVTNVMALSLFGVVGSGEEKVLPYLIAGLKQTNLMQVQCALQALTGLGARARPATPALVEFLGKLKDTNYVAAILRPGGTRLVAVGPSFADYLLNLSARTLGDIGAPAQDAVPFIHEAFLRCTNPTAKSELAVALCRIDGSQTDALDYLMTSVKLRTNAWWNTLLALGEIGTNARPAAPVLMEVLSDTNVTLQARAALVLKMIGVPTGEFVPKMKVDLKSSDFERRVSTAEAILYVDPTDRDAQNLLTGELTETSPHRYSALSGLAQAGSGASNAIPALRALLKSEDVQLRKQAAAALKIIEVPEPKK